MLREDIHTLWLGIVLGRSYPLLFKFNRNSWQISLFSWLTSENLGRPVITDFRLAVIVIAITSFSHGHRVELVDSPSVLISSLIWELGCETGPFDDYTQCEETNFANEKHLAYIIPLWN